MALVTTTVSFGSQLDRANTCSSRRWSVTQKESFVNDRAAKSKSNFVKKIRRALNKLSLYQYLKENRSVHSAPAIRAQADTDSSTWSQGTTVHLPVLGNAYSAGSNHSSSTLVSNLPRNGVFAMDRSFPQPSIRQHKPPVASFSTAAFGTSDVTHIDSKKMLEVPSVSTNSVEGSGPGHPMARTEIFSIDAHEPVSVLPDSRRGNLAGSGDLNHSGVALLSPMIPPPPNSTPVIPFQVVSFEGDADLTSMIAAHSASHTRDHHPQATMEISRVAKRLVDDVTAGLSELVPPVASSHNRKIDHGAHSATPSLVCVAHRIISEVGCAAGVSVTPIFPPATTEEGVAQSRGSSPMSVFNGPHCRPEMDVRSPLSDGRSDFVDFADEAVEEDNSHLSPSSFSSIGMSSFLGRPAARSQSSFETMPADFDISRSWIGLFCVCIGARLPGLDVVCLINLVEFICEKMGILSTSAPMSNSDDVVEGGFWDLRTMTLQRRVNFIETAISLAGIIVGLGAVHTLCALKQWSVLAFPQAA